MSAWKRIVRWWYSRYVSVYDPETGMLSKGLIGVEIVSDPDGPMVSLVGPSGEVLAVMEYGKA